MALTDVKTGMPLDELIQLNHEQPFELLHGERLDRLPTTAGHSEVIYLLRKLLEAHVDAQSLGRVFTETTFVLLDTYDSNWVTGSRTPDLMFIEGVRLEAYKRDHADWREKPYLIVPDMVIEVISPTDRYSDVNQKIDLYLQDGVRKVIIIDPQLQNAVVYNLGADQPLHLSDDDELIGGDVLLGLKIVLSTLFE